MPRPQFTLRALLVAMLVVGAFFGGMRFGERREKARLEREASEEALRRNEAMALEYMRRYVWPSTR